MKPGTRNLNHKEMKQLWSPWRSVHINNTVRGNEDRGEKRSIFSRLHQSDQDEENLILWRGNRVFVIMNLYPYNNGHLLIVPYREVAHYEALDPDEMTEMAQTVDLCIRAIKACMQPDGINVGMNLGKAAGAGIPEHIHMHVVPRWHGDTNFMPTLAETKVVPEALKDTYHKLRNTMAHMKIAVSQSSDKEEN